MGSPCIENDQNTLNLPPFFPLQSEYHLEMINGGLAAIRQVDTCPMIRKNHSSFLQIFWHFPCTLLFYPSPPFFFTFFVFLFGGEKSLLSWFPRNESHQIQEWYTLHHHPHWWPLTNQSPPPDFNQRNQSIFSFDFFFPFVSDNDKALAKVHPSPACTDHNQSII